MPHPVKGIDHCFILTGNLEKSAENFSRLGFTLSPRGQHSKNQGTANYTIMFGNDYLELLGIEENTQANKSKRQQLEKYGEGLYAIAARIDNAVIAKQELIKLGFDVGEVDHFSRPVVVSDKTRGIAEFKTLAFAPHEVPNGIMFMCEHITRNMVWRNELLSHKNGAIGLRSITVLSPSPETAAKVYARLFADSAIEAEKGIFSIHTGDASADIIIMDEENLEKRFSTLGKITTPSNAYASLAIHVDRLDKTQAVLHKNGVDYIETPQNSVAISPAFSTGTIIEFVAAS